MPPCAVVRSTGGISLFPLDNIDAHRTKPFTVATGNHSCQHCPHGCFFQVDRMAALDAYMDALPTFLDIPAYGMLIHEVRPIIIAVRVLIVAAQVECRPKRSCSGHAWMIYLG